MCKVSSQKEPITDMIPEYETVSSNPFESRLKHSFQTSQYRRQSDVTPYLETENEFEPSPNDVLCGRGVHSLNNRGNVAFRSIVDESLDRYVTAKSRKAKAEVVSSIIARVYDKGGRFIRCDAQTGEWYEIEEHEMRDKCGHALRDAKQKRTKHLRVQEKIDREQNTSLEGLLRMQQQIFEELLASEEKNKSSNPSMKVKGVIRQDLPDVRSVWAV